jgi:hypothetical protein
MKELARAWMQFKVMFLQSSKHLLQMMHVITWGGAKNNDVINVAFSKTKICQHSIHNSLKFCKSSN